MASYRYTDLYTSKLGVRGIRVRSTDPEEVNKLLAELKDTMDFRIWRVQLLPSGEEGNWILDQLHGRDLPVCLWLVKQLCLRGWEPFASEDTRLTLRIALKFKDERS